MKDGLTTVRICVASMLFVILSFLAILILPVFASPQHNAEIAAPRNADSAGGMFKK